MKKLSLILLLLFYASSSYAQLFPTLGGQRAGISTAQFLKIGVGGRASAMGDAFVAISNDASALYWNPAGLVQFDDDQVIFSHNEWVVDIKHEFLGGVYHFGGNYALGLAITSLHMDDMPVTTEFAPFGNGQYFGFGDIAVGLTYSQKMTDKFSFGATVRYIEETLDKLKMRGVMIDLGTYYWTGLGSTRFAVVVSNFGNELAPDGDVVLVGNRKKSEWQSFAPPTMFRIGFAFEPYESEEHTVTTSIQLNHPNDNSENVSLGAEYNWNKTFFVRGGYKFNVDEQNYSFGAGVNVPITIAQFSFDYSFSNFEKLGTAHRFSVILSDPISFMKTNKEEDIFYNEYNSTLEKRDSLYEIVHKLKIEYDSLKLLNVDSQLVSCQEEIYDLIDASRNDVNNFKEKVDSLEEIIKDQLGDKSKVELQLKKYQENKISALPQFYRKVHEYLPNILDKWITNKPFEIYIVIKGDNLWNIAKKKEIYNNPLIWEYIFNNNKDVIIDPDLIYPEQKLKIYPLK